MLEVKEDLPAGTPAVMHAGWVFPVLRGYLLSQTSHQKTKRLPLELLTRATSGFNGSGYV